jgi:hypothetical protein
MIPYAHRSNKPNIQIYSEHKQKPDSKLLKVITST